MWISSRNAIELAEVRIRDANGRNVGSIEAGATVVVSAQRHLYWFAEDTQRHLWRMISNLGVEWVRENYYLTALIWPHVERERGVYAVDPCAMRALAEAAANGMTVALTLGPPKNPIYEHDTPDDRVRAFSAYVRFLVRVCGPWIRYFEVLNEFYNQDYHEPGKPGPYLELVREYERIALPAMKAIKEERPDAKIILCGPCPLAADWIENAMAGPLAPFVDVISWHPYQLDVPPEALDCPRHPWALAKLTCYRDAVEHLVRVTRGMGFRGEYHANEAGAYAIHRHRSSALVSAKYLARSAVLHSALRVPVYWNETVSLLRPAWQPFFGHPEQPTVQPDCSYYTLRTLCTIMDGMEPAPVPCEVSSGGEPVEYHAFTDSSDQLLIAMWRPVPGADTGEEMPVDLLVRDWYARKVDGLYPINGEEQPLAFSTAGGGTLVGSLRVADYPLFVRLSRKDGGSSR